MEGNNYSNKFIITVMIDLKRAFETLNRDILIQKLEKYNIRGTVIKWIRSYLAGRTKTVKIDGNESEPLSCNIVVPQGSVLGPLFFIIYMNDLQKVFKLLKINLFADDTLVYIESDNYKEAIQIVNKELQYLNKWLQANKQKFNTQKTECMLISTSEVKKINIMKSSPDQKIILDGQELEFTNKAKYLGVIVDDHLTFSEHLKHTAAKISKKTGYLIRLSKFMSKWFKKTVFNTITAPHYT
jgi:ribonuclease P/MRP protein subunit RPP40